VPSTASPPMDFSSASRRRSSPPCRTWRRKRTWRNAACERRSCELSVPALETSPSPQCGGALSERRLRCGWIAYFTW
jgi:hypothetical protein